MSNELEGFKRQYYLLEQRINHFDELIRNSDGFDCCEDLQNCYSQLLEYKDQIMVELKDFKSKIEVETFREKHGEELNKNNLFNPFRKCVKSYEDASGTYSFLKYHTNFCNRNGYENQLLCLQKLQQRCKEQYKKIRPIPENPNLVIPFGSKPQKLPTLDKIEITSIPTIDLNCIITWPTIIHEMIHAISKDRSYPTAKDNYTIELKADFWSTILLGPCYPLAYLMSYGLLPGRIKFQTMWSKQHPATEMRIDFCKEVLNQYLDYPRGFLDDWMSQIDEYLTMPEINSGEDNPNEDVSQYIQEANNAKNEILSGFKDTKKELNSNGFNWDKWVDIEKTGNILFSKQIINSRDPIEILNILVYSVLTEKPENMYDTTINTTLRNKILEGY